MGKTLVYQTDPDGLVHRWDLAANKAMGLPWKADWQSPYTIACSPDNNKIAAGGLRGTIAIYDAASGKRLNPLRESDAAIEQVAYSANGKLLAVRRWDNHIDVWNTTTWLNVATIKARHGLLSMAFAPGGEKLTTGEHDQGEPVICHWDARTRKQCATFLDELADAGGIGQLEYSRDGKTLVLMDGRPRFILVDANTGKELRRFGDSSYMKRRFHLTPDGSRLVCASDGRPSVSVWDLNTGKLVHGFGENLGSESRLLALSPDGRLAAGPGGSVEKPPGTFLSPDIVLGEVATGHERLRILTSEGHVHDGAFSPDGRLLATTGAPGTINLWDTWTGKEITRLHGHHGWITLAFAPDGKTLASGSNDGTVLIWDVAAMPLPARQPLAKLDPRELAGCWEWLAGTDGVRAYRAMVQLIACPGQAEEFIGGKLPPKHGLTRARLARLIAELDADDFPARNRAYRELAALGKRAALALNRQLQRPPSLEFKRRAESLLAKLAGQPESPERRRHLRAIEVLERLATPAARAILLTTATESPEPEIAREAQAAAQRLLDRPAIVR